jgi:hypothetical protein
VAEQHSSDGWVRDPGALLVVREMGAWREGDEVEVDVKAWVEARGWARYSGAAANKSSRFGTISSLKHGEKHPRVQLDSGVWLTAHEHIVAWRPKRRQ